MLNRYKAIIYDFDGVICDSVNVKTDAFAELYRSYGTEVEKQVIDYHLANGGISRFEKIRYYHNTVLGKEINEEQVADIAMKFSFLVKNKVIESAYIDGALEYIRRKSLTHQQYICTGTPEVEIIDILDKRDLTQFFNGIYGSPKTKEDIIKEIIECSKLEPNDFVYFGDAMTDYYAAKIFNIPFIGVWSPTTTFPPDIKVVNGFNDSILNDINI